MAACLEPALNAEVNSMPQETLEEKRKVSTWVNHELRQLGLAIRCMPSALPGILVAEPGWSDEEDRSRFRIEARNAEGRKQRSALLESAPHLELMEDSVRREGRSRFRR